MHSLREKIANRSVVLLLLLMVGFAILGLKFFFVMVIQPYFSDPVSEGEKIQRQDIPRGKITDRSGNLLATSVQKKSLYANPRQITNPWQVARALAPHIKRSPADIYRRLSYKRHFIWLERKLDSLQERRIKELDLEGIGFRSEYERVYPHGTLAAQIMGIVGLDNRGLEGLEREYDDFLLNRRGDGKFSDYVGDEPPEIRLTINGTIQHIVEEELNRLAAVERPANAMIVVMEPQTGKIVAMANWPTFDPNDFSEYPDFNIRNRAIGSSFEPGSTLKVMTIGAGLAEGSYGPEDRFGCDSLYPVEGTEHVLKCYAAHGSITIPEILIRSCNVGTVKAVLQLEPETLYNYLRDFGFGNRTGIRLPGEARGSLRRPHLWSRLTQPSMAIGQGISVTALQLTAALSAVVNDGQLLRPRLVKQLRYGDKIVEEPEKFEVRQVFPPEVAGQLRGYMAEVVRRGTGQRAGSDSYRLAGKTGTAQKANPELGGYYENRVLASFIGFGPVENPRLVATVVIDEPQRGRYGGEVAAPVFRKIMERSLRYLENIE
ncbi:MAG: peptidoglycan D,D-transpeptidase FtsI family protein [bacterium]